MTPSRGGPFAGELAVAAFLVLMPLFAVTIDRIGGHDLARMVQVLLGLVCALALLAPPTAGAAGRPTQHRIWMAACAGLAALSVAGAAVPAMAAREAAIAMGLIAVATVVARIRDVRRAPVLVTSIASALYVALIVLLVLFGSLSGQALNRANIFVGYDSYRFYNHVQSAALPAAVLALVLLPRGSRSRWIAGIAAVGGFALLFAAAGRATLLGLFVGTALVAVLFGRAAFAVSKALASCAGMGLALFGLLFWMPAQLTGISQDVAEGYSAARLGSDAARGYLWGIAASHIEQFPWLGIGPMHFAHVHNAKAAHPHNVYLQVAAEWGLPMLLLLLTAAGLALARFARAIRRCGDARERDTGIGLFLACIAIAVDGLFSGNFVMPVSQVWTAVIFGWSMAWMRAQAQSRAGAGTDPSGRMSARWRKVAVLALVASQLWLAWSIRHEVADMEQHIKQAIERAPNATMNPRFWSHGWF